MTWRPDLSQVALIVSIIAFGFAMFNLGATVGGCQ